MVVGLEVVLADGTRRAHRRGAGRRRRPRPHPAVRRLRGHARRHHPGVAARPSRRRPPSAAPRTRSPPSPTASRPAGTILRRGATPAVLRLYDGVESARGHGGDGTRCVLLVLDEGDPAIVDATMAVVDEQCAGRRRAGRRRRWSTRGCSTATTPVGPAGADPQGLRRRHDGDRRPVGRARRRSSTTVRAALLAVPTTPGRQLPPVAQLPRRRLPLLHVRRHAAAGRDRGDVRRAVGRRPAGRARRRRQPVAPPRRRAQPGPLRGRGARPGARRARRPEGGARPERHPQPRQARPAVAVRRRRRGRLDERRGTSAGTGTPSAPAAASPLVFAVPVLDRRPLGRRRTTTAARWPSWLEPRRRSLGFVLGAGVRRLGAAAPARPLSHGIVTAGRHVRRRPGRVRRHPAGPRRRRPLVRADLQPQRRARSPGSSAGCSASAAAVERVHAAASRRVRDDAILVLDVGTTGSAPPSSTATLAIAAIEHPAVPAVDAVPGLVEFDAAEHGRRRARRRRRGRSAAAGEPVAAVGITNQRASTIVWDRATGEPIGPALGWQDLRTVGECITATAEHGLHAGPEPVGHQAGLAARPTRPGARDRDLCFGTVDTWLAWTLSGGAVARHRPHERRRHRAARPRRRGVERARPRRCSASRRRMLPTIVDSSGVVGAAIGAARRAADRRARRRPAGARSSARAASTRAWPRSRSAPAACSTCAAAPAARRRPAARDHGTFPIVAWSRGGEVDVGRRGDHAVGRHERRVAARRPRPDRDGRREPRRGGRGARSADGVVVRAGAARPGHAAAGTTAPAGTLLGLTRGTTPGPRRAGRARRRRPPRRRPASRRPRPTSGSPIAAAAGRRRHERRTRRSSRPWPTPPARRRGVAGGRGDDPRRRRSWPGWPSACGTTSPTPIAPGHPARVVEPGDPARPGRVGASRRAGRRLDPRAVRPGLLTRLRRVARPCPGR